MNDELPANYGRSRRFTSRIHREHGIAAPQLIFGINLFSDNPPFSFFMFFIPKEVMLLEWSYLVIEHYVAYEAYLLTAPGLLEDSSFLSPPSPESRSHDEPEHEAHSQSPVSQRRLERLTYHQQINCKLILRLRNGKEQKRGLLGLRHKKEKERASFSAGRTFESALSSTG